MSANQFRVLYRQFLFRVVDLESLSPQASGDAHRLLGQFAALLVFISVSLSLPAIFSSGASRSTEAGASLVMAMITQHFLIATTMLAVGVAGVLSWDSAFPDRRDMLVLAPLPVAPRTVFLAKAGAVATVLGLTAILLHCALGLVWPLAFSSRAQPATLPALSLDPSPRPLAASEIEGALARDLRQFRDENLAAGSGAGMAVGVWKRGERAIVTYGSARPDSLFQIGSISKTFTGLLLARMVARGKARFDEPVRELLPAGIVDKPGGREITLLDLATHRSGLPRMPTNFRPANRANPYADYGPRQLYEYLGRRGVAKPAHAAYRYSNLGLGLLGQALAERSGKSYGDLLRGEVTAPLGMPDTVVLLSADQQRRFLQGHGANQVPVQAWDLDALAGAGAIRSTAADMLTYLEANLHPEKHAALAGALAASHRLRANAAGGSQIALAWTYGADSGTFRHSGATAGFTSHAFFDPGCDCAAVILMNRGPGLAIPLDLIGEHIRQRLAGEAAISLETVQVPASVGIRGALRSFGAYWFTMLSAGAFLYGAILMLQGLAAQVLPRPLFLRVSGYLQLGAFCSILFVYFLQPGFGGLSELSAASTWRTIQWLPSYWFLGLYQQLNGSMHPGMAPLATRAWIGLAVAACGAALAYGLFYWRTLPGIVEEPDIAPGRGRSRWLPRFGGPAPTALGQFAIRTLARSGRHRMILAFYAGVGLAFTGLLMKDPATRRQFTEGGGDNPWIEASIPLWASSAILMVLAVAGTRAVFALPADLRANWIFRLSGAGESRKSSRRALWLLSVGPVWLVAALVCGSLWPSRQTAVHLAVLMLLGSIAAEICLFGFRKIPFACSYLPGKSRVHMVFLGSVALLLFAVRGAILEREAVEETGSTVWMLALLVCVWGGVRCAAEWRSLRQEPETQFEEEESPAVQELGLAPR